MEFFVQISDGQITNKSIVRKHFDQLEDGRYQVKVTKKNKRSLDQNAYYWLILTKYIQPALYDLGWREIKSKDNAHGFVADMFLREVIINEVSGDERIRTKSTTELSTVQFNEYLEEIWQWAAEYLMITIPAPNEQTAIDYDRT